MDKKKCECLFCQTKCPECGAWEGVSVEWTPRFEISNDTKNEITIEAFQGRIELRCEECGFETSKGLGLLMMGMESAMKLKDEYTTVCVHKRKEN